VRENTIEDLAKGIIEYCRSNDIAEVRLGKADDLVLKMMEELKCIVKAAPEYIGVEFVVKEEGTKDDASQGR